MSTTNVPTTFTNIQASKGHSYSNLNLNQTSNAHHTIHHGKTTPPNIPSNNFYYVQQNPDDTNQTRMNRMNTSFLSSPQPPHASPSSSDYGKQKVTTKTSSSTLSLHIAAYENSIESQKESSTAAKSENSSINSSTVSSDAKNPFNSQRQQHLQSPPIKPIIMQFKQSQRLYATPRFKLPYRLPEFSPNAVVKKATVARAPPKCIIPDDLLKRCEMLAAERNESLPPLPYPSPTIEAPVNTYHILDKIRLPDNHSYDLPKSQPRVEWDWVYEAPNDASNSTGQPSLNAVTSPSPVPPPTTADSNDVIFVKTVQQPPRLHYLDAWQLKHNSAISFEHPIDKVIFDGHVYKVNKTITKRVITSVTVIYTKNGVKESIKLNPDKLMPPRANIQRYIKK